MAYTKTTWTDDVTSLGPTNLNHMEQGIYDAHQAIDNVYTKSETDSSAQVTSKINTALGSYYPKTDTYSKTETDTKFYSKTEVDAEFVPASNGVTKDMFFLLEDSVNAVNSGEIGANGYSLEVLNALGFEVESWRDFTVISVREGLTPNMVRIMPQYYTSMTGADVFPSVSIEDGYMYVNVYNGSSSAAEIFYSVLLMKTTDIPKYTEWEDESE